MGHGTVCSTEHGRMCPDCSKPVSECLCRQKKQIPEGDGIVRVGRETKGRKEKGMTVISGVLLDELALKKLGKQLRLDVYTDQRSLKRKSQGSCQC